LVELSRFCYISQISYI